ncbi:CARDB domain-containing protein [Natrinema salinisoli]|uniref:CARDB domain-containing protein n=1 Tax=Natrinema salinisoli TaxID=2878535 RepID=UPI001CF057D0|nr:CARDB domain-containing protein [Natrinema salinisoli]
MLLVGLSAIAVGGGVATALQDGGPDSAPNYSDTYIGTVEIDGEPAPVGTTVTAEIDGEQRGSITVEEAGEFGSMDNRLSVSGTANETGTPVTFLVDGEEATADPAVTFGSGGVVSLTVEKGSTPASGTGSTADSDPDPDTTGPDFEVVDGELSADTVRVGERIDVTATVENGGGNGTEPVELLVDGDVDTERKVTLEEGAAENVTFERPFNETGSADIAVGDLELGTVTVRDRAPAAFEVATAQVSATELEAGESVDVTATVRNVGEESKTDTVQLVTDGSVAAERDVTLDGNESETVSFTESFERAGEHEIAVGDADARTVTVTDEDAVPGFGVATAIAALVGAVVGLRARNGWSDR